MQTNVSVLIVGAGPVGLMAAILLHRLGIPCQVIERRAEPQRAPAAHVVNGRTFEICRAAGVDMAALAAASTPAADAGRVRWVTTLAGEELGSLPYERQGEDVSHLTPTPLLNLSQHRFEPILVDTLERLGGQVAWGCTWEGAVPDVDGVTSQVRQGTDMTQIRSRWLLAADGAGSRVRKSVGIELLGPPRLQSFVMMHFEANLREVVRERPGILYWTTHPGATGALVAHDIDHTWVYMHPWDPEAESITDYPPDVCATIVRRALGTDTVPFIIRTISPWTMSAQVAERYRAERIFLVGDSAHRFPPTGGLGLNTGIQDAHNLAWKLAAVDSGRAGMALLDTYESERRPVAQRNADVSLGNALRLGEVYQAVASLPDGRAELATAIANQADHFDQLGLQLGFVYAEGALLGDGAPVVGSSESVREFVPTAQVGARLPHAWVGRGDERVSTLDHCPLDRFTLIVTPVAAAAWRAAVDGVEDGLVDCVVATDDRWTGPLELAPGGALLVRPDQHIAWRLSNLPDDPPGALRQALDRLLRREAA